jgi:rhodanese-related sulfurtransferase
MPNPCHAICQNSRSFRILACLFSQPLRAAHAVLASLALVLSLGGCQPAVSDSDLVPMSVLEAKNLWNQAQTNPKATLFLDPRASEAFAAEHIPGARNIEIADAAQRARVAEAAYSRPFWERARLARIDATLADYDALVVYADNAGSASARVLSKLLIRQRFRNVYLFEGGLLEWKQRGGETQGTGLTDASSNQP